jgi:hypothetical protein
MNESSDLQEICNSLLPALSGFFRRDRITARFYPYIGMTHTIRRRGSAWMIRISDHCREAPRQVLEAILLLLAHKVLRRKPPAEARRIFERFRRDPEVEGRVQARRLERGRKQIRGTRGKYHELEEIFSEVNETYFNGQVEVRRLGWGSRRSWRRLGHYDPVHNTITVSPVLDAHRVPRMIVAYLLYHEMLHTLFTDSPGGKRHHTAEFNRAERAFPSYAEARRFLDHFCRTRGRKDQGP